MAALVRVSLLFTTFLTFDDHPGGFSVPYNFCVAFV